MDERTCVESDCDKRPLARNLCSMHYHRHRRAGSLPDAWQKPRPSTAHLLSAVDAETRTADCTVCGPGVAIRIRQREGRAEGTRPECAGYRKRPQSVVRRRRYLLWSKYGMTLAEYQIRYEAQGGKCLICRQQSETLAVDHCHLTGRVRGLLCTPCNLALGMLSDNAVTFERAAAYLKRAG